MHAGAFYPDNKRVLAGAISEFMAAAKPDLDYVPRALILPHAGYSYSGPTAAYGYKLLAGARDRIRRVILLAPSHYAGFMGAILNARNYESPLGTCVLDAEAAARLGESGFSWASDKTAESREHADEVHVPFLKAALPDAKIVPVLVGDLDAGILDGLARALSSVVDDSTVLIVSSDFTHYGPRFGYAPNVGGDPEAGIEKLDRGAMDFIVAGDLNGFAAYVERTGATICGRNAIYLLLKLFKSNGWVPRGRVLHYTTSGAMTGDFENSVSYAAIALGKLGEPAGGAGLPPLSKAEEATLLKLARHVLDRFVREGIADFPDSSLKQFELTDRLKRESGVFVTLTEQGRLRGCIGSIRSQKPLYRGVIESAMNAAARDPRFNPVEPGELKEIEIEISVMSPMAKVGDISEIEVGRDGLMLINGPYSGVFLPQVPVEWKWDRTMYLEKLGEKAGLSRETYKHKDTELFRFTAQVFEEGE